jgi:CheY-like chemotaxis protein
MTQRVFVKVMGFTAVERHALNTVFRLSEQRDTVYSLWVPEAPDPPELALVDGLANDVMAQLETQGLGDLKLIWVGAIAPAKSWRTFERPLSWPDVLKAMDELFAPAEPLDFDFDLEAEAGDTHPPDPETQGKRALIAGASLNQRLYFRARLALAGLTLADDAETGAQALEMARSRHYDVAVVDFTLADMNAWTLLKALRTVHPPINHLVLTKDRGSLVERIRALMAGTDGIFGKPPHPGKLQAAFNKV